MEKFHFSIKLEMSRFCFDQNVNQTFYDNDLQTTHNFESNKFNDNII